MGLKKRALEEIITISSKGQIVIPKEIRSSVNLHEGERILARVRDDNVIELVPLKKDIDELFSIFGKNYEKNRVDDKTLIRKYFEKK